MIPSTAETTSETKELEWSDELEGILKKWGEEAKGLHWMHGRCEKWFNVLDKCIGAGAGILAVLLSLSIFATNCDDTLWIKYTFGGVSFVSGSLVFLQNYLMWGKRSTRHGEAARQYEFYYKHIESELALERKDRDPGRRYYKSMKQRHLSLVLSDYPTIPDRYITQYKNRLYNTTISRPAIADNITEIKVNKDEPPDRRREPIMDTITIEKIRKEEHDNPAIQYELERYGR